MGKKNLEMDKPVSVSDVFSVPVAGGDSFAPQLTPEQQAETWREVRALLDIVLTGPTTLEHRRKCDDLMRRLNHDPGIGPLMLRCVQTAVELERTIAVGEGQREKAREAQKELQSLSQVAPPSDSDQAKKIRRERERLEAEFLNATKAADASDLAGRQLCHVKLWAWPLFTPEETPFKEEKDFQGNVRRQRPGALSGLVVAPAVDKAARDMGLDPYLIDSWKNYRKAEVQPSRRRYRTSSPTSAPTILGQPPYSRSL